MRKRKRKRDEGRSKKMQIAGRRSQGRVVKPRGSVEDKRAKKVDKKEVDEEELLADTRRTVELWNSN